MQGEAYFGLNSRSGVVAGVIEDQQGARDVACPRFSTRTVTWAAMANGRERVQR